MNNFQEKTLYIDGMAGRPSTKEPTESGARLAAFRKAAGLSQIQLAGTLGIPQRTLSFYEREASAIPSSLIPRLANMLGVGVEDLLGMKNGKASKRGPKTKLDRQLDAVKRLPRSEQEFVGKFLENVLKKAGS